MRDPSGPRPEGLVKDDSVAQHVRVDHKLLLACVAEDGQNGANGDRGAEHSGIDMTGGPPFGERDRALSVEPPWDPRTLLTLETRMEHGINRAVPVAAQVPG